MNADDIRGHAFYPDDEAFARIPRLYETDGVWFEQKVIYLHYFVGGCDWWVAEVGVDRRIAFGFVNLGDPQNAEWGYIDLVELRRFMATRDGIPLVVERDLQWRPRPFGEVHPA